jgi:AraC-like DNA-binding protein
MEDGVLSASRRPEQSDRGQHVDEGARRDVLEVDLSLDMLAATAGINRFHLLRIFKRTVGMTPHAYVTARRVARGKTLLAQGSPVADAALAVGFFDQSHFANRFRQTYGMTPRTFQLGWEGA